MEVSTLETENEEWKMAKERKRKKRKRKIKSAKWKINVLKRTRNLYLHKSSSESHRLYRFDVFFWAFRTFQLLSQSIWKYEACLNIFSWAHFRTYAIHSLRLQADWKFSLNIARHKIFCFLKCCFLYIKCSFSRCVSFSPLISFIEMNETNRVCVSFALLPLYRFEIPFELILLKSFKTFKKHYTNGECKQIKYYSERVYQMEKVISILFKNIFDPNMSERVSLLRSLFSVVAVCSFFFTRFT